MKPSDKTMTNNNQERVEEIVKREVETMWIWVDDNKAGPKDFEVDYMKEFESTLRNALTQYHQDLMSDAVERLEGVKYGEAKRTEQEKTKDEKTYDEGHNAGLTEAQSIIKSLTRE